MAFGSDIGGVLAPHIRPDKMKVTDEGLKNIDPRRKSFDALRILGKKVFGIGNIYLVSVCDEEQEKISRRWLEIHDFEKISLVPKQNWIYCRSRDKKSPICFRYGITDFVDDRQPVLDSLETVSTKFWFNTKVGVRPTDPKIITVRSWAAILEYYRV